MDERNAADKRKRYVHRIAETFQYGKDIRLYRMQGYLHSLSQKIIDSCQYFVNLFERRSFLTATVTFLVVLIRDGLAYGFLIYKAVAGEVDAAQFVLYFSAVTALSGYMNDILTNWGKVAEGALQISDFREDLEIRDRLNHGNGIPTPKGPFTIEFKDVCYKYPMGAKQILDHVSFKIEAGEKIALVGLNGAGKTTLTMLMCGLLLPDRGEVLIDGHSILEYNRDALPRLLTRLLRAECMRSTPRHSIILELDKKQLFIHRRCANFCTRRRSVRQHDAGVRRTRDS